MVFQCRLQKLELLQWVASQCGADSTKFLQWHSSVGLFQLSFSSGVPVYPASIRWVAQWYPSVHWVNQWHSSGIRVYTGPASVHWLRVRLVTNIAALECGLISWNCRQLHHALNYLHLSFWLLYNLGSVLIQNYNDVYLENTIITDFLMMKCYLNSQVNGIL